MDPEVPAPDFFREIPDTKELTAMKRAFERGDYAYVRAEAKKLASDGDEAVRRAAALLVERTKPDPLSIWFFAITAALLVVLAGWWIVHGKAPPGSGPPAAPPGSPPVERVR
jgi:hypothetical protein